MHFGRIINRSTYFFWGCVLLAACVGTKDEGKQIKELSAISVKKNIQDSVDITPYLEEIEVIPLKMGNENLLGEIYKVFYTNEKFILFDRLVSPKILLFDEKGAFIKVILRQGRGPGEAVQIDDCWLTDAGNLEAYDAASKTILHFDERFEFIGESKIPINTYHNLYKIPHEAGYLAFSTLKSFNETINGKYYQLEVLEKDLMPAIGLMSYPGQLRGSSVLSFNNHFFRYRDTVRFMRAYDNQIYHVKGHDIVGKTNILYEDNMLTWSMMEQIIMQNTDVFKSTSAKFGETDALLDGYSYFYGEWLENEDFISFVSKDARSPYFTIYDKKASKVLFSSRSFMEKSKYNIYLPTWISAGEGYFIGIIDTIYLKQYLLGKSVLGKFVDNQSGFFLLVKIKLKSKM